MKEIQKLRKAKLGQIITEKHLSAQTIQNTLTLVENRQNVPLTSTPRESLYKLLAPQILHHEAEIWCVFDACTYVVAAIANSPSSISQVH